MTTNAAAAGLSAPIPTVVRILLLGAATAGAWFGWFGWDHEYQTDPVTGVASGPYETWQGVGAVLTLLAIGILAVLGRIRPVVGTIVMTVAFTAAWCVTEMPQDDTGLSGVGAIMVFAGMGMATGLWFWAAAQTRFGRR
jgi:hypothetical protein